MFNMIQSSIELNLMYTLIVSAPFLFLKVVVLQAPLASLLAPQLQPFAREHLDYTDIL